MFARSFKIASVLALAGTALAGPISRRYTAFDGWHGISSLSGFDDFYGVDNFSSSENVQTIVSQSELVCTSVDITVIQQQIAVLVENAKRVILQEICQVETQTVVVSQVQAVFSSFSESVRQVSSVHASYDSQIAGYIGDFVSSDGSLYTGGWGFSGSEIGGNSVIVGGSSSEGSDSVAQAFAASQGNF